MGVFASWESIHHLLIDHGLDAVIARSELRRSRPGRRPAAGTPASTVTPARAVGAGLAPERRAGW